MAKLSISYRRSDSADITGRIFDRLVGHYGKKSVFRDIDNVPIGEDFWTHIQDVLHRTDVLLAVVGPEWRGPEASGRWRVDEENDLVRVEVETGLKQGIPVIPVLVGDADMPTAEQLPESLKPFSYRNAIRIDSGYDFDHHVDRLIRKTDEILDRKKKPRSKASIVAAAAGALLLLLGIGAILYYLTREERASHVPWLAAAYEEIGQKEIDGPENNERIMDYIATVSPTQGIHDDGFAVDWASAFVAWSLDQAGVRGLQTMDPVAWLGWGRAVETPEEGCIVVFNFTHGSHIGFYVGEEGPYVKTLGGNQDDSVKVKIYAKAAVAGYRLPSLPNASPPN
jgi:uncharacterized protein (TIGR02594 family)